jgi:single-strand DNA-binding protein
MAGETLITVVGNLTGDPELRFTPGGDAVVNFTVASTPRTYDKQANEWKDGDTLFLRCSCWRKEAENVAESLVKGDRVIVQGALVQRSYETREGEKRTVYEMQVNEVGAALKFAPRPHGVTAANQRAATPRTSGVQQEDPWATPASTGGGAYGDDDPPF